MKKFLIAIIVLFGFYSGLSAQERDLKTDAKTHYELGNIFYQQGRFEEAQQEYQKAIELMKESESVQPAREQGQGAKEQLPVKVKKQELSLQEKVKAQPSVVEYIIGEDDVIGISVWQNPDLDQEVIVRPDGMISFPLIGDVLAKGMSIPQLDEEVTKRLSEFVRSPEVSMSLKKIGGSKVIVLGEIIKPGVYSVAGTKTILEAISQAGGFSRDAVPSSVVLVRGGLSQPKPIRLNLSKVLQGREVQQQNIVLQSEDIIFVPKKFIADLNYFLGQILDPISKGAYTNKELKSY
ncbi:MAG: polysaccharide biosynthesis/export family protein [Candidatus Omnitrophota bacterium]